MSKDMGEVSKPMREAWRVDVLDDTTAGHGVFRAYNSKFTLANEWSYGHFEPKSCFDLPGKQFVAKASGDAGCNEAFLTAGISSDDGSPLYSLDIISPVYVAWRVMPPTQAVPGGRFSFVKPDGGPWRLWCEFAGEGKIDWVLEYRSSDQWQTHRITCASVKDNWLEMQLILSPGSLVLEVNRHEVAYLEHDGYQAAFCLKFGSVQTQASGGVVASTFRNVYVDAVPYLFEFVDIQQGPEDIRSEDNASSTYVCEATLERPRHSEGDLIELKNGDLMLVWSEFHTGKAQDWQPSRISAKVSNDLGKTWGPTRVLVERNPKLNHPTSNVSLIYATNGDLLMAHTETLSSEHTVYSMVLRRSKDHGETWSQPLRISPDNGNAHHVNNGCFRKLSTGRLILPSREYIDGVRWPYALYSDDDGFTWQAGVHVPDPGLSEELKRVQNVNEPCIEELPDGRLLMTMRSFAGGQFFSYSDDGGQTWTKPRLSPLRGINSPATIRRVPGTSDILAVWNYNFGARAPLHSAISSDGGKTWRHLKLIEASPYYYCDYVSVTFVGDRVVLTYESGPLMIALQKLEIDTDSASGMRVTILPIEWFYRQTS